MSSIKSFIGTLAVLFSVQPIASWAAEGSKTPAKGVSSNAGSSSKDAKAAPTEKRTLSIEGRDVGVTK